MTTIIYILTNQAMPGIIKIGYTDSSVEQRMKELDKTPTPLPFECYHAKKVVNNKFIESKMHEVFDAYRLRNNREFFRLDPNVAKAALDMVEGEDVTPIGDVVKDEADRVALNNERNRNRFNFIQIGIEPGTELSFKKNPSIKAIVKENDQIEFRGRTASLSQAALEIVHEMGYKWNKIAGPQFWTFNGKTLYELSKEL